VVSYGIRRCEFDQYLLERSGAHLKLGENVREIERSGTGWLVNRRYRASLLVGGGGHFCPVARWLGASLGSGEMVVAAKEIEFALTPAQQAECPLDAETPELYFCRDLQGYGWCLRKGDYLNIGLGREDNRGLAERLEAFRSRLSRERRIPAELPDRFHGHAYLLYPHSPRTLFERGALLIGDAAGLAYLESGEGIRPAVESGLLAAETVIEAGGDYRAERLAGYADRLAARFGPRQRSSQSPPPLLGALRRAAGRGLLGNRWLTRRLVLDRWFLHRHQGPLELENV
jgi:flavin-dependent dehydrogenase